MIPSLMINPYEIATTLHELLISRLDEIHVEYFDFHAHDIGTVQLDEDRNIRKSLDSIYLYNGQDRKGIISQVYVSKLQLNIREIQYEKAIVDHWKLCGIASLLNNFQDLQSQVFFVHSVQFFKIIYEVKPEIEYSTVVCLATMPKREFISFMDKYTFKYSDIFWR